MRRLLILGLALGLVGMGPVPLSACALITSQMAECKTPETQPVCDKMDMSESGPRLAGASEASCCFVSKAPVPEARQKISNDSPAISIAIFELSDGDSLSPQRSVAVLIPQDFSPPSLRSLLCTFLI